MTDLDGLLERAQAAFDAGNHLVARGYWRRASRIAPGRLDIWLNLYQITEEPAERLRCLEHIVDLDPDDARARQELASLQAIAQRDAEAAAGAAAPALAEQTVPPAGGSDVPAYGLGSVGRQDITAEMRLKWDEAIAAGRPLVCIDHPQTETGLRCNQCGAPVCTRCAVRTPVGFRCKGCIKAQQAVFFTARWTDYPIAVIVSLVLSIPAAVVAGMAGWWFALIISPFAGGLIGGIVHRAVGRRRGRWTWLVVAACVVLGALIALVFRPSLFISIGIYAVMATSSAVGILRMGRPR